DHRDPHSFPTRRSSDLAGFTAVTLYLLGIMCQTLFGLPAPVAMLFIAVIVKLTSAVSPQLQQGSYVVYKFFSTAVTYPLLFAIRSEEHTSELQSLAYLV